MIGKLNICFGYDMIEKDELTAIIIIFVLILPIKLIQ